MASIVISQEVLHCRAQPTIRTSPLKMKEKPMGKDANAEDLAIIDFHLERARIALGMDDFVKPDASRVMRLNALIDRAIALDTARYGKEREPDEVCASTEGTCDPGVESRSGIQGVDPQVLKLGLLLLEGFGRMHAELQPIRQGRV